jgi:hypothetical protein
VRNLAGTGGLQPDGVQKPNDPGGTPQPGDVTPIAPAVTVQPSIKVGNGGDRTLSADANGVWMGRVRFGDAPFAVDMDGHARAATLDIPSLAANPTPVVNGRLIIVLGKLKVGVAGSWVVVGTQT